MRADYPHLLLLALQFFSSSSITATVILLLQIWNCNANLITVWYSCCLKGTWYLQTAIVHSKNLSWPEPRRQRRIYIMAQMKAITMDSFYRISYPEGIFMIITITEDLQFGELKINLFERNINNHARKQPFCWLNS